MEPSEVLAAWERIYEPLEPEMRDRFLARPEVASLRNRSRTEVLEAFRRYKKLVEACAYLGASNRSPAAGRGDARSSFESSTRAQSWKADQEAKPTRKRRRKHVDDADVAYAPKGTTHRKRGRPPEGRRDPMRPEPPVDADLLKRVGPVQNYEDEF